jgi:hypothetical protein
VSNIFLVALQVPIAVSSLQECREVALRVFNSALRSEHNVKQIAQCQTLSPTCSAALHSKRAQLCRGHQECSKVTLRFIRVH